MTGPRASTRRGAGPLSVRWDLDFSWAVAIVFTAAAAVTGLRALRDELPTVFRYAQRGSFPASFTAQRDRVTRILPPGETLLHVSAAPELWYSHLWQRSLYPRNPVIVIQPPVSAARLAEARAKYGARFVISAGHPPFDPGYRWKTELGPLPGLPGDSWFGELAP